VWQSELEKTAGPRKATMHRVDLVRQQDRQAQRGPRRSVAGGELPRPGPVAAREKGKFDLVLGVTCLQHILDTRLFAGQAMRAWAARLSRRRMILLRQPRYARGSVM